MSQASKIEWTDATWNPIRGCSRVSEGCRHCYAERVAARFSGKGQAYEGLAVLAKSRTGKSEAHWTGKVRLVEELLDWPLRRKKPLRIFVNSMSDLFHESVPIEWIARIFNVMACATVACGRRHEHEEECWTGPQHTFQILTKRPERMLRVVREELPEYAGNAMPGDSPLCVMMESGWPLTNIWLGVSVEDQATADERIPLLLQTPAAVRWISAEPLLGPMDLESTGPNLHGHCGQVCADCGEDDFPIIDWVVVGGESGPGARSMDTAWASSIVEQCKAVDVPVFMKQLGSRPTYNGIPVALKSRKGGLLEEMPGFLRVRQFPEAAAREHDEVRA